MFIFHSFILYATANAAAPIEVPFQLPETVMQPSVHGPNNIPIISALSNGEWVFFIISILGIFAAIIISIIYVKKIKRFVNKSKKYPLANKIFSIFKQRKFNKLVEDILLLPESILIIYAFAKEDTPLSAREIKIKSNIKDEDALQYNLEILLSKKVIEEFSQKFLLTDVGNKLFAEIQRTLIVPKTTNLPLIPNSENKIEDIKERTMNAFSKTNNPPSNNLKERITTSFSHEDIPQDYKEKVKVQEKNNGNEVVDIEFNNLEIGKVYPYEYKGERYAIKKINENEFITYEVTE